MVQLLVMRWKQSWTKGRKVSSFCFHDMLLASVDRGCSQWGGSEGGCFLGRCPLCQDRRHSRTAQTTVWMWLPGVSFLFCLCGPRTSRSQGLLCPAVTQQSPHCSGSVPCDYLCSSWWGPLPPGPTCFNFEPWGWDQVGSSLFVIVRLKVKEKDNPRTMRSMT